MILPIHQKLLIEPINLTSLNGFTSGVRSTISYIGLDKIGPSLWGLSLYTYKTLACSNNIVSKVIVNIFQNLSNFTGQLFSLITDIYKRIGFVGITSEMLKAGLKSMSIGESVKDEFSVDQKKMTGQLFSLLEDMLCDIIRFYSNPNSSSSENNPFGIDIVPLLVTV